MDNSVLEGLCRFGVYNFVEYKDLRINFRIGIYCLSIYRGYRILIVGFHIIDLLNCRVYWTKGWVFCYSNDRWGAKLRISQFF